MALAECGIKLFGVFPAMPVRQLKHLQVALATIPVSVVIITTMNTPTEVKPAKATVAEKGISEITHVIMSRESISAHDIIRKNRKRPLDRGSPDGNAVVGEQPTTARFKEFLEFIKTYLDIPADTVDSLLTTLNFNEK